jgi:ribosomal protein L11 methyltransferase
VSTEKYFELHIKNLKRQQEDLATGKLFGLGAAGVSETLQFTQKDLKYNPEIVETEDLQLVAYFESWNPEILENFKIEFPMAQISLHEESQKDWMEEWKKGFEPFALAGDTWIVPSWRTAPAEAKNVIYIDPGMAFGTGTHETTRVCSLLINEYCKTEAKKTSVDIGTGTGILAILMEQLGFQQVYCGDIDPECKRVSEENFEKNKTQKIIWQDDITSETTGPVDLIVANIIDGVLLELQDHFRNLSSVKTQLILSGILSEREEEFTQEFLHKWPLRIVQRHQMGEWVGLWLKAE